MQQDSTDFDLQTCFKPALCLATNEKLEGTWNSLSLLKLIIYDQIRAEEKMVGQQIFLTILHVDGFLNSHSYWEKT